MADSSTLRIEIEPKGAVTSAPVSPSDSGKKYTQGPVRRIDGDDPIQEGFREAIRKAQNEKETQKLLEKRRARERAQEDRQERDESWLARREAAELRKREAQERRAEQQQERDENYVIREEMRRQKQDQQRQKQAERMQERDENYADRQEARARREAAIRQKRDEDWYEKDQRKLQMENERRRQREENSDPANIAKRIVQWQQNAAQVRAQVQVQRIAQAVGLPSDHPIISQASRLATSFASLTNRVNPLIFSVSMLKGVFDASQRHFREEAERVRRLSPQLRLQEIVNNLRQLQTDAEIAQKYGSQMAKVEDRASRWERANRLASTKFDSMMEDLLGWADEFALQAYEWFAGVNDSNQQSVKYLKNLFNLSEKQVNNALLEKHASAITQGIAVSYMALTAIGEDIFDATTFDKLADGLDIQPAAGRNQPEFPIVKEPEWWKNREM